VDLSDPDGHVIARGLVNYDAAEIPALMGRSTRWLAARKGPGYEREVVHRDDLVILGITRRRVRGSMITDNHPAENARDRP
jgi:glutamate 5-kinase